MYGFNIGSDSEWGNSSLGSYFSDQNVTKSSFKFNEDKSGGAGGGDDNTDWGTKDYLNFGLGALKTIGGLWSGYQQTSIAKEQMKMKKDQFKKNYEAIKKQYNNSLNGRYKAMFEGQTDAQKATRKTPDKYKKENSIK